MKSGFGAVIAADDGGSDVTTLIFGEGSVVEVTTANNERILVRGNQKSKYIFTGGSIQGYPGADYALAGVVKNIQAGRGLSIYGGSFVNTGAGLTFGSNKNTDNQSAEYDPTSDMVYGGTFALGTTDTINAMSNGKPITFSTAGSSGHSLSPRTGADPQLRACLRSKLPPARSQLNSMRKMNRWSITA